MFQKFTSSNLIYLSINIFIVLLYFIFSIKLTFYNKKYIVIYPYPITISLIHLCIKFFLAWFFRLASEKFYKVSRNELLWHDYYKISITGLTSSLDIGLSNWSFKYITISLYTMTKSTSIIFILFFSIILKLEKKRISLVFIVLFISLGLLLFTYESTQFQLQGFLLCLSASAISGIRWSTTQLFTQHDKYGLSNPIDVIYHIQPWMILTLLPLSISFEGLRFITSSEIFVFKDYSDSLNFSIIVLFGAALAFALECSEYLMVSRTSSLTLCISGIIKEMTVLTLSVKINHDKINFINLLGLVLCFIGIILHVFVKFRNMNEYKKVSTVVESSDNELSNK